MEEIKRQLNQEEYLEHIEKWKLENKELINNDKCRKAFLENLPKTWKGVDWDNSIKYDIYFIYDNIQGYFKIIDSRFSNKNKREIIINYNGHELCILADSIVICRLGRILNKHTLDFKVEIGIKFKDKNRDIVITDRKYIKKLYIKSNGVKNNCNGKWYKYTCNKCGWTGGWIVESHLLGNKQTGCSCCYGRTPVLGINTIYDTDPWMIPYIGEECAKTHTHSSGDEVCPICPECNRTRKIKMKICTIKKYQSIACICSDGVKYPNKFAFKMLKQLNIKFINEFNPDWIKPKAYDFYFELDGKQYILEMDGGWHFNDNNMSGQTIEKSKKIDNYKDEQARLHGVEVIRIACNYGDNLNNRFEYIKQNTLNSKLCELFNLSIINFNECNKYALSNLIKIACEYKRDNPELTTGDIGRIMGYSTKTIREWLKQGTEVEWCNYDTKKESERARSIGTKTSRELSSNPIICVTTGHIFLSCAECERTSLKILGIRLSSGLISAVCNGKRNHTHHLVFRKIRDLTEEQIKEIQENAIK
jgi:hypothetical protein